MKNVVRLGAGSGFWGDATDPAMELLEHGRLDYICFDYLAELTMALLERQRRRDRTAGYVPDAVAMLEAMMRTARRQGTRLISNGGGVNPQAGVAKLAEAARAQDLQGLRIAAVSGDSVVDRIDEFLAAGHRLRHFETGEDGFAAIRGKVVSASVYADASGILAALDRGADIVLTGRVSDNAPYVGALMHEFGWRHDADTDAIGAAITAGHLVECAAGCTGGMSSRFDEMPNMGRVGFPILDVHRDGTVTLGKLPGTGGRIDLFTVKEHLLYEIGDPANYLMPDGIADFTTLRLEQTAPDRVRLSNMTGRPRTDTWKMVVGYEDGWIGEGMLFFPWPHALARAHKARITLLERFDRMGLQARDIHFDLVGVDMLHGPAAPPNAAADPNEVGLRVAVRTATRDEAEKVRRACANLWILGPGGTAFGAPMKPRPVIAAWPTLIPRALIPQHVDMTEV